MAKGCGTRPAKDLQPLRVVVVFLLYGKLPEDVVGLLLQVAAVGMKASSVHRKMHRQSSMYG